MKIYKMSYSDGLLSKSRSYQTMGEQGPQGLPGVSFKLTPSGNYDMQNKKLVNVHNPVNLKDALNWGTAKTHFLKLDGSMHMTGDLDLRGNKLILPGEIDMGRKLITNMDTDENNDLCAVNMITLKNKVGAVKTGYEKDIDLQDKYNVKNSKQQSFDHLAINYDNLISYDDAKNIFLSRKETFPMETGLDMGNQTIFNVKDPTVADHGVNKKYVDAETAKTMIEINKVKFDSNTNDSILESQIKIKTDKTYVDAETTKLLTLSGGTNQHGRKQSRQCGKTNIKR